MRLSKVFLFLAQLRYISAATQTLFYRWKNGPRFFFNKTYLCNSKCFWTDKNGEMEQGLICYTWEKKSINLQWNFFSRWEHWNGWRFLFFYFLVRSFYADFFGPDTDHVQGFFFSLAQKKFHWQILPFFIRS